MKSRSSAAATDIDNRSRLLHAATDAFAEQGFDGTSLRTIADSAGVAHNSDAIMISLRMDKAPETPKGFRHVD